jgi:PAS domain S-box-containing protein
MNVEEAVEVGWSEAQADCRRVFADNSQPMWVVQSVEVVDVNQAAVLHYGYSRDEFLATPIDAIEVTEESDAGDSESPRVRRHRKRDGALIDVELTSFAVTFRGRPASLTSVFDVTYRRRTEVQTRYLEHLLTAVVASDDGVMLSGGNAAGESRYGRRADEVLGQPGAPVFRTDLGGVERIEAIQRLRETGRFHGQLTHRRADGERIDLESRAAALFDGAGNRLGYVSVTREIPGLRLVEETLRARPKPPAP